MPAGYLLALIAVAACHASSPSMVTPDASSTTDATPAETSGLYVHWWADPDIPGDVGNNTNVATALFRLTSLQVIGDASPGGPNTSEDHLTVEWTDDDRPDEISFKQAPVGVYSQLSLQIDGLIIDDSYAITGKVSLDDQSKPFEIHDLDPMSISVPMSTMLQPDHAADVTVHIDFAGAISTIDWSTVTSNDDGTLELDSRDDQMSAFRAKLVQSFTAETD